MKRRIWLNNQNQFKFVHKQFFIETCFFGTENWVDFQSIFSIHPCLHQWRSSPKLKCEPPTTKSECLQVVKPIRACSTLLICSCFGDCERETGDGEQRRKLKIGNSSNAKHCTNFLSQSHHKVCIEFKCCELTAILTVSSEYFKLIWVKKGRENFRAENCSGRAGEKFCRTIVKCNRIFLYESAFNSLQSWFTI